MSKIWILCNKICELSGQNKMIYILDKTILYIGDKKLKEVDNIDIEILKILSNDSRKKLRPIAEKLKHSPTTISKHQKELEEKGIIKNYSINLDYEKIGYDIIALIELTISKGKMLEVEKEIAHIPNIYGVYDVTGTFDALILARFKTRSELSELVKEINSSPYVVHTNTHLILNVIKEESNFAKLIEFENAKQQKP